MAASRQVCAVLAVLLVATVPYHAAAEAQAATMLGKGGDMMVQAAMPLNTGKGGPTVQNVDVQCDQVCNDVCTPVPNKVCNDIPYQTQVCNKVPVQKTKQVCNRVCTKTTTVTEAVPAPAPMVLSSGKGGSMMVNTYSGGKGGSMMASYSAGGMRRLAGANAAEALPLLGLAAKAVAAAGAAAAVLAAPKVAEVAGPAVAVSGKGAPVMLSTGKGAVAAPQVDVQCNDVCNDVPYTEYTTQCQMVQQTKTKCDIVFNQKCDKVCKPNCRKVTTFTTTTTQALSNGKGMAMPVMSMGKGL